MRAIELLVGTPASPSTWPTSTARSRSGSSSEALSGCVTQRSTTSKSGWTRTPRCASADPSASSGCVVRSLPSSINTWSGDMFATGVGIGSCVNRSMAAQKVWTGTADRIVDPLLVRATDDPVVADCVLDSLTAQPVRQFGRNHRIIPDVARVGAPAAHRIRVVLSGATQDADHELRRSPVVGSVGRDCRERVLGSRAL
jgi:hypothetical protein